MKLKKARISTFRSIVRIDDVDIDDRLTVLIGKNEQGKTTFLKALVSFQPGYTYLPGDLPNHLAPKLTTETAASELPIVTLWFAPTGEDHKGLQEIVPNIDEVVHFKITKYYDGHYHYQIVASDGSEKELEFELPKVDDEIGSLQSASDGLKAKLAAHAARLTSFAPHKAQADAQLDALLSSPLGSDGEKLDNTMNSAAAALTGVPGQDQPIQDDIAAFIKDARKILGIAKTKLADRAEDKFLRFVPRLVYHSSVYKVPNGVPVAEFIANPEAVSRGMANLCLAAGMSMKQIGELAAMTDIGRRHVTEDFYTKYISGGINEYWTQEKYSVKFQVENGRLTVSIEDGTYPWRIPPENRSEGFQWYLSFYCALLGAVSSERPTIILLDNPALELHADGQRDIKKFLEEKLRWNTQILYVTHSPAMIDPYQLEQVREVVLQGKEMGTIVRRLQVKPGEHGDLLEPVRSAIGASIVNSLMFNEFNILVEGAADKPILEGAIHAVEGELERAIVVNGSVAETREFLPLFYEKAKLPYVVYLDADSGGRDLEAALTRGNVSKDRILSLRDAADAREGDFEIEDILSADFYYRAIEETYSGQEVRRVNEGQGKVTKKYEELFRKELGFEFTKRRVALTVKRLLIEGQADEETRSALTRLVRALVERLRQQVTK